MTEIRYNEAALGEPPEPTTGITVRRWNVASIVGVGSLLGALVVLAFGPSFLGPYLTDRLTTLFAYVILAAMWNALAGYAGLVSVGQQAFFGLGAYAAIRLAHEGTPAYVALAVAPVVVGVLALALSPLALRLRGGEFAIGMWVFAELAHLLVNLDGVIQGETGTSLRALSSFAAEQRRAYNYWFALAIMTIVVGLVFFLLRSRTGASIQAIRDSEEAAASVGVRVMATKRLIFVLAAAGCAAAGAIMLSTLLTFQPKTYFSVQWSAYMIFMTLVGGLGTFEGPLLGAVLFFTIESFFGGQGVWYLVALGAAALAFSLFIPRGIWGELGARFGFSVMPLSYRLHFPAHHDSKG